MHAFFWLEKKGSERASQTESDWLQPRARTAVQDLVCHKAGEISEEMERLLQSDYGDSYSNDWGVVWHQCESENDLNAARAEAVSLTLQIAVGWHYRFVRRAETFPQKFAWMFTNHPWSIV